MSVASQTSVENMDILKNVYSLVYMRPLWRQSFRSKLNNTVYLETLSVMERKALGLKSFSPTLLYLIEVYLWPKDEA
jgi:hypothetical protein